MVHLNHDLHFDGAILLAPMVKIVDKMKPPKPVEHILRFLAPIIPHWPVVPSEPLTDKVFKLPHIRTIARANPLKYNVNPRVGTALQLFELSMEVESRLHEVSLPFLILVGS